MLKEKDIRAAHGLPMFLLFLATAGFGVLTIIRAARLEAPLQGVAGAILFVLSLFMLAGLFIVQPNEARVLTLFGRYTGSARLAGLWWANPLMQKATVSLRVRNFETAKLKVNDSHSNPIEIAAVVVWKVVDSAEALFEVDDYERYVAVQCESALRGVAQAYPYDAHMAGEEALSTHQSGVSQHLRKAIEERMEKAGVEILEARISHLAYAPEIAMAMLQRQQAAAIIAARQKIVEGAVGMVENALQMLSARAIVHLDDERRAQMVSNLLVVLCSERSTQPVVNTGTIYA